MRAAPNRLLAYKEQRRVQEIHHRKLEAIRKRKKGKGTLDNAPPKTTKMKHLYTNMKKEQIMEERFTEIERENRILLGKMTQIMKGDTMYSTTPRTAAVGPRSLNLNLRRRELERINNENQALLWRIQSVEPQYRRRKWENDYDRNHEYMQNISQFVPTMEFQLPPGSLDSPADAAAGAGGGSLGSGRRSKSRQGARPRRPAGGRPSSRPGQSRTARAAAAMSAAEAAVAAADDDPAYQGAGGGAWEGDAGGGAAPIAGEIATAAAADMQQEQQQEEQPEELPETGGDDERDGAVGAGDDEAAEGAEAATIEQDDAKGGDGGDDDAIDGDAAAAAAAAAAAKEEEEAKAQAAAKEEEVAAEAAAAAAEAEAAAAAAEAAAQAAKEQAEPLLKRLFELLDSGDSGRVRKKAILLAIREDREVRDMFAANEHLKPLLKPHAYLATFEALDTNHDGAIEFGELLAFCHSDDLRKIVVESEAAGAAADAGAEVTTPATSVTLKTMNSVEGGAAKAAAEQADAAEQELSDLVNAADDDDGGGLGPGADTGYGAIRALFAKLDSHKRTGKVAKKDVYEAIHNDEEVRAMLRANARLSPLMHPRTIRAVFDKIDTNADGYMQLDELLAFCDDGIVADAAAGAGTAEQQAEEDQKGEPSKGEGKEEMATAEDASAAAAAADPPPATAVEADSKAAADEGGNEGKAPAAGDGVDGKVPDATEAAAAAEQAAEKVAEDTSPAAASADGEEGKEASVADAVPAPTAAVEDVAAAATAESKEEAKEAAAVAEEAAKEKAEAAEDGKVAEVREPAAAPAAAATGSEPMPIKDAFAPEIAAVEHAAEGAIDKIVGGLSSVGDAAGGAVAGALSTMEHAVEGSAKPTDAAAAAAEGNPEGAAAQAEAGAEAGAEAEAPPAAP